MTAPTKIIRIGADGSIVPVAGRDLLGVARLEFGASNVCVVTCAAPWLSDTIPFVGAVHEWGVDMGLPLNPKAWLLYGRSPIVGPMLFGYDQDDAGDRPDLPAELVETMRKPLREIVSADVIDRMLTVALGEGFTWKGDGQ